MRRALALLVLAGTASSALWRLASRFPLPRRDIGRWLVDVGPADAAMSVVRVAALATATYLAVIAVLHLVVPTWSRAGHWVSTLTPPSLRAMLVTSVLATSSAGVAFAGARAAPPPPVSIALSDPAVIAATPTVPDEAAVYSVKSGDSFWSIAEVAIAAHLGRPPSVAEIGTYWRLVMSANSERLVHAGVPDLIYPGQEFVLPQP
ncbi:MAG: LysM peptidoglycan-binding domain-containing protein [Acidimicrobiales bacterium]